jgi:large subunit ribosomal protein L9
MSLLRAPLIFYSILMKIILLQDAKNLGKKGNIKDVTEGYARNFLFPKKLAEPATEEAIKNNEAKKSQEKAEKQAQTETLKTLAEKIKNKKFTFKSKEEGGKLFGSVSAKDIAELLKKEKLAILEKSIIINEAIKKIGDYEITIALSPEIKTIVKLEVTGEK